MPPPPLRWGWQRRALLSPLLYQRPISLTLSLRTIHTRPSLPPTSPRAPLHPPLRRHLVPSTLTGARTLRASPQRCDIIFLSMPALKSTLLGVTRFSLLALPFVWRYKLWRKYKRTSWLLIQIPIFAFCIVVALGLDQSPRTGRWRLLLMSENEELAWSYRKHKEVLAHDGPLVLSSDDPRSQQVVRVATRLVTALEEQNDNVVSGAAWPPREDIMDAIYDHEDRMSRRRPRLIEVEPSAVAHSNFVPFRPLSSNPLKGDNIKASDWDIYIIDLPQLNAFALPSKEIFVYTGLLDVLPPNDDSMVAAVLSHEIAHVAERHSVENLGFLNLAAVVFDVLRGISFAFTISFPVVTDGAGMFLNWLNDVVAERAYSRKIEEEADSVGLEIMARAGYHPRAMLDLWELMAAVEADAEAMGYGRSIETRFQLLRTHPTSEARQEAIASQLPKAMGLWQAARAPQRATIEKIIAEQKARNAAPHHLASDEVLIGAVVAKIQPRVEFVVAPELPEPEPEPELEPEREV
ncbi:hypothetical protein CcaverHIS002_0107860 [Cutaneotrichosporon cavernicola]|uniref:Peptidase M48 domain-containing protein n=1 Tax=Cutaneotrichosporon cavernicola TaxID=279322 RepID=A0AA48IDY1_9TREE|nr:uncharacterized protein CcaverHIS019_0107810 [Cutaneotrichosporon cavernicola]BEI80257.1 hypothetical protein CcaverHIS002_0107860 [Cutaneotrichosporon cavernicola]BEI88063.1 hypothetical protein CcaverHIS019_0107810 [Cutaneotrichosporon cavernicola]BEI95834.1 hypothetical protein CcaverHIS631_0107830 [Cutaneotrichosporon cavernicola]BEJ03608.1 hypothetical protein CcaverHIS641_0107830 [Cutaneotrichosporon cavernicola]